jgi:hypothetical protein
MALIFVLFFFCKTNWIALHCTAHHRAPEGSTTKSKMMYASTKEFLKGYLEGVGLELQVCLCVCGGGGLETVFV